MTDATLLQSLSDLFRESGPAHHRAYIETDGFDPEWPLWYAGYLQERLNRLMGKALTQSELVYWLIAAEKDRQQRNPSADWPNYYAHFFLENV